VVLRGRAPALEIIGPVGRTGGAFLFQERLQMIDPFTVLATAVGFAIVASLMLAAIEQ
jgi:hypothetical protein